MNHTHWIALAALLVGMASRALGAFPVPANLGRSSETQKLQYLEFQSRRTLQEKIEAGQQRYEQRLAFRRSLLAAMQTNAEEHRQAIFAPLAPPVAPAAKPGPTIPVLLAATLLAVGFLFWDHLRRGSSNSWLSAGIRAIRRFPYEVAARLDPRFDPWELLPSTAPGSSANIRAEDAALAEFVAAFQVGPSAAARAASPDAGPRPRSDSLSEFFARAPMRFGQLRKLVQEIGRAPNQEPRRTMLADLQREISALKGEAGVPHLLPLWQMAVALEGLVKQLTGSTANVTPSTLRTVAGGVDLLENLCIPGLKPDLLTNPPLRILAVDDDPVSRNAVSLALRKALNPPELAESGEAALAMANAQAYDLVFLDVEMTGLDGFEVCTRIHQTPPNRATPVVFVTCHSDFESRARSTLSGGSDLIGKPFLTFEITVKALTLSLRRRLRGGSQSADFCELTPGASPPENDGNVSQPGSDDLLDVTSLSPATMAATTPNLRGPASPLPPPADELGQAFLDRASAHIGELRALAESAFQTLDETVRQQMLTDFYLRLQNLMPGVGAAHGHPALRTGGALAGLLKKLLLSPKDCTLSTLLTLTTAVDLLNDLCKPGVDPDLAVDPPIRLLVVDDDPVARRALLSSLQMSFEKPESADSGEAAVALAKHRPFDAIFMDVRMPGMDGFAACLRIHESAPNRTTPVAFTATSPPAASPRSAAAAISWENPSLQPRSPSKP